MWLRPEFRRIIMGNFKRKKPKAKVRKRKFLKYNAGSMCSQDKKLKLKGKDPDKYEKE